MCFGFAGIASLFIKTHPPEISFGVLSFFLQKKEIPYLTNTNSHTSFPSYLFGSVQQGRPVLYYRLCLMLLKRDTEEIVMKKLCGFLCLAALVAFVPQLAAQSGDYSIADGKTGAWTVGEGTHVGTFSALKDSSLSFSVEKNNTLGGFNYGTFQYDAGTAQIVANSEMFVGSVAAGQVGPGNVSVTYSAGNMVGVWVEYDGQRYYSVSQLNSNQGTGTYKNAPPDGYANVWFDTLTSNNQKEPKNGAAVKLNVTGVAPAASGAPLPGVLATVALCSAVGGYLRRKKTLAQIEQQ